MAVKIFYTTDHVIDSAGQKQQKPQLNVKTIFYNDDNARQLSQTAMSIRDQFSQVTAEELADFRQSIWTHMKSNQGGDTAREKWAKYVENLSVRAFSVQQAPALKHGFMVRNWMEMITLELGAKISFGK